MSLLSRFKILTKILAVIGLLSAVAIFITVLGVSSLKHLDEAAQRMELVSDEALLGQRLSVSLLSMNRAEFQLVADPRPANRAATREAVNAEAKLFRERLQALAGKVKRPELKAQIAGIEQAWALYQRDLEETFRAANAVTNFQSNEQLDVLRKDAQASAEVADKLRGSLRTLSDGLEKDLHKIATEADEEYKSISLVMEIAAGAGILLGLLFGFLIGQYGVARPIRGAVELLKKLANGDYNVEVSGAERKDEVGDVARTALVFKENGLAKLRMEQEQQESEARVAAQRKADMRELAHQFESAVGTIIEAVSSASTQLETAAGALSDTAATTQQLSGAVATASEQASANVQSVATATEELSGSVDEIGRRVQDSSRIAANAVQQAGRTDAKINELSQAAARIGDVVKLITAIAEQTNLLALNATIEAARAGEAGRGFAVVASEVKSLANQTAKATEEISTQIAGMQQATTQSVTAIKEIGATIEQVAQIASAIAAAVEEQGAATMEISRNVQQAAQGTTLVASSIADVNRGASGTGSASAQVLASAKSLSTESHNLKQAVGSFLATVRAA